MTDQYLVLDENFAPTAPAFTIDPRDWEKRDRDLT